MFYVKQQIQIVLPEKLTEIITSGRMIRLGGFGWYGNAIEVFNDKGESKGSLVWVNNISPNKL